MATASAIDVARHLIHLATPSESEDADCLCHMRLQKLLYYVQGWHLGAFGRPLFVDRIEAWTHGPVVKDVYPVFAGYGFHSIPPAEGQATNLPAVANGVVQWVWKQYGKFSATALRTMTHKEPPWVLTRGDLGPTERSDREITAESMRAYFFNRYMDALRRRDKRIDLESWVASGEDIREGRYKTARELRDALLGHRVG